MAGFSLAVRNARLQILIVAMDGASTVGKMKFYDGVQPATGVAITTQTLCGENELFNPSGSVAAAELTFNLISDDVSAKASSDITWCRIVDGDGNFVMDLTCGIAESGANIIFDTVTIILGGTIKILSGSILEGNA